MYGTTGDLLHIREDNPEELLACMKEDNTVQ